MYKVIIAGGRHYEDYATVKAYADYKLSRIALIHDIEIVSGGATGADALGERYAREKGYTVKRFSADWKTYGKAAGPRRNREMAAYADALLAFWDGSSKGTMNMIQEAEKQGLKVGIKRYE